MKIIAEVNGTWLLESDAKLAVGQAIMSIDKATGCIVETAEQHEQDVKQGFIEFRVYLHDVTNEEQVHELANQLQDMLMDEAEVNSSICSQEVTYQVVQKKSEVN